MDAVHFNSGQDNPVVKKAVYIAVGTKIKRTKEVLGMRVESKESAKYWPSVMNGIRNRGAEDIILIS